MPERNSPEPKQESLEVRTTFSQPLPQQIVQVAFQQTVNSFPINSQEIAALRQADPAALELLYKLIDRQQLSDIDIEKLTLRAETRYRNLGLYAAVIVMVSFCAVAALAIINGHPREGAIIAGTAGLASIAGVFVRGRSLGRWRPDQADHRDLPPAQYPAQQIPTQPPKPPA